jgi:predicted DNA binding CopG/RHH family protein
MRRIKLPTTDSIRELAEFWDTHDMTDFEDELEEVTEEVFDRERAITLRLPRDEAESIHKLAALKGVDDAELIREWVREKIGAK